MDNTETTAVQDRERTLISELPGAVKTGGFSKYGVIFILLESTLVGFSLFVAYLIQQPLFNGNSRQFLVGQGEIIRMSLGIAFCYAFICVLRRGYQWGLNCTFKDTARSLGQYIVETHVLFLALLFLVRDVNFMSIKLTIGTSLVTSAIFVISCRSVYLSIRSRGKSLSGSRKITLKKAPFSYDLEISSRSRENIETDGNTLREEVSKIGGLKNDNPVKNPLGN